MAEGLSLICGEMERIGSVASTNMSSSSSSSTRPLILFAWVGFTFFSSSSSFSSMMSMSCLLYPGEESMLAVYLDWLVLLTMLPCRSKELFWFNTGDTLFALIVELLFVRLPMLFCTLPDENDGFLLWEKENDLKKLSTLEVSTGDVKGLLDLIGMEFFRIGVLILIPPVVAFEFALLFDNDFCIDILRDKEW